MPLPSASLTPATPAPAAARPPRRWPALAAAAFIAAFCLVATGAVGWDVLRGNGWDDNGVVLLAVGLRSLTVVFALAAVQAWGARVPAWVVGTALWGAAAVQLAYPVAETVVKTLVLTGAIDPIDKGISDMSGVGWFNFGAAWLVWGVPGVLFLLAAVEYCRTHPVRARFVALGVVGGAVFLGGLGVLLG